MHQSLPRRVKPAFSRSSRPRSGPASTSRDRRPHQREGAIPPGNQLAECRPQVARWARNDGPIKLGRIPGGYLSPARCIDAAATGTGSMIAARASPSEVAAKIDRVAVTKSGHRGSFGSIDQNPTAGPNTSAAIVTQLFAFPLQRPYRSQRETLHCERPTPDMQASLASTRDGAGIHAAQVSSGACDDLPALMRDEFSRLVALSLRRSAHVDPKSDNAGGQEVTPTLSGLQG